MKRTLAAIALLCTLAAPAQAVTEAFPTERAIGATLGLAGPGLAWRHFPISWLGYQVGANSWGILHSYGGALLLSPYRDDYGQRFYLSAGVAYSQAAVPKAAPVIFPAFGVGASKHIGDNWTYFADLSFSSLTGNFLFSTSYTIPIIAPQIGVMYTF